MGEKNAGKDTKDRKSANKRKKGKKGNILTNGNMGNR